VIRLHNSYHWGKYLENINDVDINYVTMNLRIKTCTNGLSLLGINSLIFNTGDIYHTRAPCPRHSRSRSAHAYARVLWTHTSCGTFAANFVSTRKYYFC